MRQEIKVPMALLSEKFSALEIRFSSRGLIKPDFRITGLFIDILMDGQIDIPVIFSGNATIKFSFSLKSQGTEAKGMRTLHISVISFVFGIGVCR